MHDTRALPSTPLRGYALVAQIFLVAVIGVDVWIVKVVADQRSFIDRVVGNDPSVTLAEADDLDHSAHVASNWFLLAILLAAVAFVVWFWRVRTTAGEYSPDGQRRSRAWAFWGWVCPIVNLWFPFQIADDAMNSVPSRGRPSLALLRFWWAAYLLAAILNRLAASRSESTVGQIDSKTKLEIGAAVVEIVAGVLAILVIASISRRLDRHRERLLNERFGS